MILNNIFERFQRQQMGRSFAFYGKSETNRKNNPSHCIEFTVSQTQAHTCIRKKITASKKGTVTHHGNWNCTHNELHPVSLFTTS